MSIRNGISAATLTTICALGLALAQAVFSAADDPAPVDTDHDGVPDHRDQCPNTTQLKKLPPHFKYRLAIAPERYSGEPRAWPVEATGCEPDSDSDGVIDSQDYCRDDSAEATSGGVAANGCPVHSDFDGTPDFRDQCPGTPRGVPTDAAGCPVQA